MAAVIFDLDDTLYPHVRYVNSGFAAVARHMSARFGLRVDEVYGWLRTARETGSTGREFQKVCAAFGLETSLVPELIQVFRNHRPEIWLWHDVRGMLEDLRHRGFRTAVLTNGLPSAQAAKVRALGLDTLVDDVMFAEEYAPGGKPAAEPFIAMLRRLDVAPRDAIMVGDNRVNDIEGARAVGLHTILLARHERLLRDSGADAVVNYLADLPHVVVELLQHRMADAA